MRECNDFLAGVIEGFYGPLWSRGQRLELLDQMSDWGLNTYLYAPKDDLKHRSLWRQEYGPQESEALREMIQQCLSRNVRYVYALSPGLDIRFSDSSELDLIRAKLGHLESLGCRDFALLFDDIPDVMHEDDRQRWDSFAAAQCCVTNTIFESLRKRYPESRFLFCPTPYCGRMQQRGLGGAGYLETVGSELAQGIEVFWTGPEIISKRIDVPSITLLSAVLKRKPLIWDNLHANDYDGRRIYCGPYAGRPLELRDSVSGILINPNCEFPLNFVPTKSFADYVHCQTAWDPRHSYLSAMEQWLPRFQSSGGGIALQELVQLGDCFYLPHEEGPGAQDLYQAAQALASAPAEQWHGRAAEYERLAKPLRNTCAEIANLFDRSLFAALSRRTWELREELDLMLSCIRCRAGDATAPCTSDYHLPQTYRGGLVPRLQQLLKQNPDGTFTPQSNTQQT